MSLIVGGLVAMMASLPVLASVGGAGAALIVLARLRILPVPWRLLGAALLAAFCFLAGVRLQKEWSEADALKAMNERLHAELRTQRLVAETASKERDQLQADKATIDKQVSEYEDRLKLAQMAAPVAECSIDDADLRFRDGLRRPRRGR